MVVWVFISMVHLVVHTLLFTLYGLRSLIISQYIYVVGFFVVACVVAVEKIRDK